MATITQRGKYFSFQLVPGLPESAFPPRQWTRPTRKRPSWMQRCAYPSCQVLEPLSARWHSRQCDQPAPGVSAWVISTSCSSRQLPDHLVVAHHGHQFGSPASTVPGTGRGSRRPGLCGPLPRSTARAGASTRSACAIAVVGGSHGRGGSCRPNRAATRVPGTYRPHDNGRSSPSAVTGSSTSPHAQLGQPVQYESGDPGSEPPEGRRRPSGAAHHVGQMRIAGWPRRREPVPEQAPGRQLKRPSPALVTGSAAPEEVLLRWR